MALQAPNTLPNRLFREAQRSDINIPTIAIPKAHRKRYDLLRMRWVYSDELETIRKGFQTREKIAST